MSARRSFAVKILGLVCAFCLMASFAHAATAQPGYPVPQIIGPTHPSAVVPGSLHFTLDVYGANFINGSTVNWNGSARITTFVSAHHLRAQVNAADVVSPTSGFVTVTTNSPNGAIKSSTYAQVLVHQPMSGLTLGASTRYIVVGDAAMLPGDLSGRNLLDLTVNSNDGNPGFTSLLNNGDGTFQMGAQFASDYYGGGGGLGDFDGNGKLDLAYVEGQQSDTTLHGEVALGQGSGIFSGGQKFDTAQGAPPQIAVGDFNQDGIPDIVTASTYKYSLFLGNGDGTFRQGQVLNILGGPLVVADINGDGKLDLVAGFGNGFGVQVQVLLGNGDGTFQKALTVASPVIAGNLFVTDVNGDGNEDIVFSDFVNVWVIRGNGDGTFRKAQLYTFTGGLAIGDFNADGKADIVQVMPGAVSYMAGNGNGTFAPAQVTTLPELLFVTNIASGDFNADGSIDLAISGDGVKIFLQP